MSKEVFWCTDDEIFEFMEFSKLPIADCISEQRKWMAKHHLRSCTVDKYGDYGRVFLTCGHYFTQSVGPAMDVLCCPYCGKVVNNDGTPIPDES